MGSVSWSFSRPGDRGRVGMRGAGVWGRGWRDPWSTRNLVSPFLDPRPPVVRRTHTGTPRGSRGVKRERYRTATSVQDCSWARGHPVVETLRTPTIRGKEVGSRGSGSRDVGPFCHRRGFNPTPQTLAFRYLDGSKAYEVPGLVSRVTARSDRPSPMDSSSVVTSASMCTGSSGTSAATT